MTVTKKMDSTNRLALIQLHSLLLWTQGCSQPPMKHKEGLTRRKDAIRLKVGPQVGCVVLPVKINRMFMTVLQRGAEETLEPSCKR